jgi:hypothetical protein
MMIQMTLTGQVSGSVQFGRKPVAQHVFVYPLTCVRFVAVTCFLSPVAPASSRTQALLGSVLLGCVLEDGGTEFDFRLE